MDMSSSNQILTGEAIADFTFIRTKATTKFSIIPITIIVPTNVSVCRHFGWEEFSPKWDASDLAYLMLTFTEILIKKYSQVWRVNPKILINTFKIQILAGGWFQPNNIFIGLLHPWIHFSFTFPLPSSQKEELLFGSESLLVCMLPVAKFCLSLLHRMTRTPRTSVMSKLKRIFPTQFNFS